MFNRLNNTLRQVAADNEGSTLSVFAITLPLIIGALAISIEAGYWFKSKSDVQLYADMAAYAGVMELQSSNPAEARNYAKLHALHNGFSFNKGDITVHSPPITGAFQGEVGAMEVVISQSGLKFFSGIISDDSINYQVRSVAAVASTGDPACIVALNETDASTFEISGSTDLVLDGCAIHSNSVHGSGTKVGNRATLDAKCLSAVGGIIGDATLECGETNPNSDPLPDPYASLPAPVIPSTGCRTVQTDGAIRYIVPGVYCNDINIGSDFEFRGEGEYYFDNANMNFTRHADVTGDGITIILMNDSALNGINGNADIRVSAQTSGTYAGVVVYSDPNTQPAERWTTFNGNSGSFFEGLMYYPNQNLNWGGTTSSVGNCTLIVGNKVIASGSAEMVSTGCESNFGITPPTANGVAGIFIVE